MSKTVNLNHYIRQMGLANPEKLTKKILIVGAGSIGSWTALALLKLGCSDVTILDFDEVEEHNAGSQVYTSFDAGKTKLAALGERLEWLAEIQPTYIQEKITPDNASTILSEFDIVIGAIDNIEGRKLIYETLKGSTKLYIDGRMAGNAIEIYTVPLYDTKKLELYESSLFTDEEAIHVPCSERSVVYNCFVIAGLLCDIVNQHCQGDTVPGELIIDLQNFTMFN